MSGLEPTAETHAGTARDRFVQLHTILRSRICLLDYPPGVRLSEEKLAAEFGVSRTPLRRVLASLEDEGLVRSVHGVGTIVTDVDIDELAQVYVLRMELAELFGKLSPLAPTPKTVEIFRAIKRRCDDLVDDPSPRVFAEINMSFFHALMTLTGNEPLKKVSERLYYRTARIWLKSISRMDLAEEIRVFSREVTDILAAIELGDIQAAAHIRRSHISMSFTRLKKSKRELEARVTDRQ